MESQCQWHFFPHRNNLKHTALLYVVLKYSAVQPHWDGPEPSSLPIPAQHLQCQQTYFRIWTSLLYSLVWQLSLRVRKLRLNHYMPLGRKWRADCRRLEEGEEKNRDSEKMVKEYEVSVKIRSWTSTAQVVTIVHRNAEFIQIARRLDFEIFLPQEILGFWGKTCTKEMLPGPGAISGGITFHET